MSTNEVSGETGVPTTTLRYWRHADQGPASFSLGKRVVYRREEVERCASPLLVEERQQRVMLAKLITALGLPLGTIEGAAKGTTPVRGLYGIGG